MTIARRAEILHIARRDGAGSLQGAGLLIGDHLGAAWSKPTLGGGAGVILFALGERGLINAAWAFSPFAGQGALNATRVGTGTGFEGKYQGSFVRADGIALDSGVFDLTRIGQTGDTDQYKFTWKGESELLGAGVSTTGILGRDNDEGQWLVVGFTRSANGNPVTVADYAYDLDKLEGKTLSLASADVTAESLARKKEPLDY
jgi:hypothetical protein